MTRFGCDVSKHQPGISAEGLKVEGAEFMVARCSYGGSGVDEEYAAHKRRARAAGLLFGGYHFVYDSRSGSGAEQAANIVKREPDPNVRLFLDLEPSEFGGRPTLAQAEAVRDALVAAGRRTPGLYFPRWYWEQMGKPDIKGWELLWGSGYPTSAKDSLRRLYPGDGHPYWEPYGGMTPAIWQFASTANLPGYAVNTYDADAFKGTAKELAAVFAPLQQSKPDVVDEREGFLALTWNVFHGSDAVADLQPLAEARRQEGVAVWLLQEASMPGVAEMLRELGLHTYFYAPQFVTAWDPQVFVRVAVGGQRLSETPYATGRGGTTHSEAGFVLLCDPKGRSLLTGNYHTPAHIQVPDAERPEHRYRAAGESFATLGRLGAESQARGVLFGGDDNVDESEGIGSTTDLWAGWLARATGLRQVQAPTPTFGAKRRIDDFRIKRGGGLAVGDGWTYAGTTAEQPSHRQHVRQFWWR